MKASTADRLMESPEMFRTITAPSPRAANKVAALLVEHNDGVATVCGDMAQISGRKLNREWFVQLSDVAYR